MQYPRILIINEQSVNKNNATGITLRSILSFYPCNNLFEIHMDDSLPYDKSIKLNNSVNMIDLFPIAKVLKSNLGNKVNNSMKSNISKSYSKKINFKTKTKKWIRGLCHVAYDIGPLFKKKEIINLVNEFKPEIIYTLGASVDVLKISYYFSQLYNINIVIHFMDDWPHFLQDEEYFYQKIYKLIMNKWLKKCYSKSKMALTISPKMANIYEKEYGIKHVALMSCVYVEEWFCKTKKDCDKFIFVYAGGLHLSRWKALKLISEKIKELSERNKIPTVFYIYTKKQDILDFKDYFNNDITILKPYVSHEELLRIYSSSDVLVHAETLNDKLLGYFRFSISTKIPEYLSTNRPILFFGPSQMYLYNFLEKNDIAFVADDENHLLEVINEIMINKEKREKVSTNALNFAKGNYHVSIANKIFHEVLMGNLNS